jgi:hypothetical protein
MSAHVNGHRLGQLDHGQQWTTHRPAWPHDQANPCRQILRRKRLSLSCFKALDIQSGLMLSYMRDDDKLFAVSPRELTHKV